MARRVAAALALVVAVGCAGAVPVQRSTSSLPPSSAGLAAAAPPIVLARQTLTQRFGCTYSLRGCCSHHGGVCGVTAKGAVVCCDKTSSPTCRCR